jgi:hypothetical protein
MAMRRKMKKKRKIKEKKRNINVLREFLEKNISLLLKKRM